jgi:UDP-glucose 4-epimerase
MQGFDGATLLVTGGTGSFGHALVARALQTDIGEIRIFSRDEEKQDRMRRDIADRRLRFHVGDVRDAKAVADAMHRVDYVFHAAALKQVPSCEFHPMEAIKTNVLGAENVLSSAVENEVKACVVLSTDKAVYPINAMGMSKALMEKLMVAKSRLTEAGGTVLCATRYGNVMGSRGSVIPYFTDQIRAGSAVTVTDPTMTRFLMSLPESVDLVLTAFKKARSGDIFIRKAPASTIGDLAEALKALHGSDVPTRIIGTRHGEKLFETLVSREEMAIADDIGDYYRIPADGRDLNYNLYFDVGSTRLSEAVEYTSHNTERLDVEGVKAALVEKLGMTPRGMHA